MSTVLISTHHLPVAGRLRDAFRQGGYRVELVTPSEDLTRAEVPSLLVVTAPATETATLLRQAAGLELPALVVSPERELSATTWSPEVAEAFGPGTQADEVALVGRRIIERRRLQRETGSSARLKPSARRWSG